MNKELEKENEIIFYLNKDIYKIKTIMKASYKFIEDFYILLDYCDENIKVVLESKNKNDTELMKKYKGEFYNELLRQNVRYTVSKDTRNIRELLMGKALYDTCIEYEDSVAEETIEENSDINDNLDILVNWFDKSEE